LEQKIKTSAEVYPKDTSLGEAVPAWIAFNRQQNKASRGAAALAAPPLKLKPGRIKGTCLRPAAIAKTWASDDFPSRALLALQRTAARDPAVAGNHDGGGGKHRHIGARRLERRRQDGESAAEVLPEPRVARAALAGAGVIFLQPAGPPLQQRQASASRDPRRPLSCSADGGGGGSRGRSGRADRRRRRRLRNARLPRRRRGCFRGVGAPAARRVPKERALHAPAGRPDAVAPDPAAFPATAVFFAAAVFLPAAAAAAASAAAASPPGASAEPGGDHKRPELAEASGYPPSALLGDFGAVVACGHGGVAGPASVCHPISGGRSSAEAEAQAAVTGGVCGTHGDVREKPEAMSASEGTAVADS
ncbi:MAG: hypothetical protein BJ554DRAFT_7294, partial [Olpidium bornovanus]